MTEMPRADEWDFPDEMSEVDLFELNMSAELLDILLQDKTTGGNILWATEEYASRGGAFAPQCGIMRNSVIGSKAVTILPRVTKSREEQRTRTRKSAEVFTPAWLCNDMANLCDEEWFGRKDVFNTVNPDHTWQAPPGKIQFPPGKTWRDYVDRTCLEIACGEAPYLVSRYDASSGDHIPLPKRIGLLDRKLRIISERARTKAGWFRHALRAYKSTYGYEYQGDNLLLARQNLLWTFDDYYFERWQDVASDEQRRKIAEVISWNIWQMDGLTDSVPFAQTDTSQLDLFLFAERDALSPSTRCKIRLWPLRKNFYLKQLKGNPSMKFDVVIGNPPYQLSDGGNKASAVPIYHLFVQAAKTLNPECLEMIIPARWFSGGRGLDDFRIEMLSDNQMKRLHDYFDSEDCFPGVDISGGVCYFLRKRGYTGDCLVRTIFDNKASEKRRPLLENGEKSYIRFNQAVSIYRKVVGAHDFQSFDKMVSSLKPFGLRTYVLGGERSLYRNIVIYSNKNASKQTGYISREEILQNHSWVDKHKVMISRAYGERGKFPYFVLGKPFAGEPGSCCSETYLVIGPFENEKETKNVMDYIRTKFFRFMVLLIKNTQDAPRRVYSFAPMQDFSKVWTDAELYKKYGLNGEEIDFIEAMVRPM